MKDEIVVEQHVHATPDRVYRYLTESALWARWQGADATIEATPGGLFRMAMSNGLTARGQFVELEQNRRVVFTWGWVDHPGVPPGSTTVEIELLPVPNGTLLRLTHRGLTQDEIPSHLMGWEHYLPRLATAARGGDPGPDQGPTPKS